VVLAGGWTVIHLTGAGLDGLAAVAATGLAVYGASLAIAFRAGLWRTPQPQTVAAVLRS
jgi:hypothetical protein